MRSAASFWTSCAAVEAVGAEELERALRKGFRGRVLRGEPLSRHTSLRVGGPADLFLEPEDQDSLVAAVARARELDISLLVIGCGTNLLVSDRGFRGAVVSTKRALTGIRVDGAKVYAGAGEGIARLARECAKRGLAGLEGLGGIPGTVGGAVVMNAGAFGFEVSDCLEQVEVLWPDGTSAALSAQELGLGYRSSRLPQSSVVLSARFGLEPADPQSLTATLWELDARRRETQPIGLPSAGCMFRNPPGDSAGRLIEAAGGKGLREGGAQVSEKHANFILNVGGATADDVRRLMDRVRSMVAERFGVVLDPEVQIVGEWQ